MGRGAASTFNKIAMLLLSVAALLLISASAMAASFEYAVKATYLYKFVPFIGWPASSFPSPNSPINICIFGKDPFGQMLDQVTAGQRIDGRTIVVRRVAEAAGSSGCHIVYMATTADPTILRGFESLRGQSVLTVSDSIMAPADRGIINFLIEDNRVRFEIDERAAEQSHLAVSSKLLSLAYQKAK